MAGNLNGELEWANGRARISIKIKGPAIVASVASEGIETKILTLTPTP